LHLIESLTEAGDLRPDFGIAAERTEYLKSAKRYPGTLSTSFCGLLLLSDI
jgi:hypothetical protein